MKKNRLKISPEAEAHVLAFADAFMSSGRREVFCTQLIDVAWRREYLDRLNHLFTPDLIPTRIHSDPPVDLKGRVSGKAYIIADEPDHDDTFQEPEHALDLLEEMYFGGIVCFEPPGLLAAYKPESPAAVKWLY